MRDLKSRLADRYAMGGYEKKEECDDPTPNAEMKAAWGKFLKTFEDFKAANDRELDEIKKSLKPGNAPGADAVTADQVKKLNDALTAQQKTIDELRLAQARTPKVTTKSGREVSEEEKKHQDAFVRYMRKGDENGLAELEAKTLSAGSQPDGGYLVTPEVSLEMDRVITQVSPMRSLATVRSISSGLFTKPFNLGGVDALRQLLRETAVASGWVGESGSRSQTNNSQIDELRFNIHEIYAHQYATQTLLDDAAVNIEQWLAEEAAIEFAYQEGVAFVTGDGVKKPEGFVASTVTKVANASWAHGKLGYVVSGANGAFVAAPNSADCLVDLVYALKTEFRSRATFVMNALTTAGVRKLKDSNGDYYWQPSTQAGQPASLMGYPVVEMPAMGNYTTTDEYAIAFGDFKRCYLIVDRIGVRTLRDPYSNKPYVTFYVTKRMGGGIQNWEGIKLLKFGTS